MRRLTFLLLTLAATQAGADPNMPGTDRITYFGYEDCILLENAHTRVVLTSSAGRILEYSRKGPNAIYLDPAQEGATFEGGDPPFGPTGGRLDIGPEMIIPAHPDLWLGQWESQITGPRSARLISKKDEPTGVQLIRDFQLAEDSTHLSVTQTIKNVSDSEKHWGHWSRTFGTGGGIVLIPLTPGSRFPDSYIMYGPGPVINYHPGDPNIRIRDNFLEVLSTPLRAKLGMDSQAGWFAYLDRNDLLWIKRYPVVPRPPLRRTGRADHLDMVLQGSNVRVRANRPARGYTARRRGVLHRGLVAPALHLSPGRQRPRPRSHQRVGGARGAMSIKAARPPESSRTPPSARLRALLDRLA